MNEMEEKKPSCFIIMPISTPDDLLEKYDGDTEHFVKVLDNLFIPAISDKYKPIRPIAKGAEIIQAEVAKNLETAHIVLCDISTLNPNVLFELGIRTALNKPVCVVKDELTSNLPTDLSIINCLEYASNPGLNLGEESKNIATHLKGADEGSHGENTYWRTIAYKPSASPRGKVDPVDALSLKLDAFMQKIDLTVERASRVVRTLQNPQREEAYYRSSPEESRNFNSTLSRVYPLDETSFRVQVKVSKEEQYQNLISDLEDRAKLPTRLLFKSGNIGEMEVRVTGPISRESFRNKFLESAKQQNVEIINILKINP